MVKLDVNRGDLDHAVSTMKDLRRIADAVKVQISGDMVNVKLKHLPSCVDEEFQITYKRGYTSVGESIDNVINFLEGLE
tara:strand:+ start:2487 stop:2723 length:237 start_codon:yes stop_codon:yes gene_type:complete